METQKRPATNAPTGLITEETRKWAEKESYKIPTYEGTNRVMGYSPKGGRGAMRRALAAANINAPTNTGASLADLDFNGPLVLKKGLKGSSEKKTCLVEVGARTLVVKGGSGNVEDHVAATNFIRQLGLNGVKAPMARALGDVEKDAIARSMEAGGADAKELAESLRAQTEGQTSGLVAELGEGVALDGLIPQDDDVRYEADANDVRKLIQDKSQDEAWASAYEKVVPLLNKLDKPKAEEWKSASDAGSRKTAISYLREKKFTPEFVKLVDVLAEIDQGSVKESLRKRQEDAEATKGLAAELKTFAASPEGIEAFAGVAVADLVCGMDDRLLTKHNGGNFLFDAKTKTLCCIDNSKAPEKSLNAPDMTGWRNFVSGNISATKSDSVVDMIYKKIYTADKGAPNWLPGKYVVLTEQQQTQAKQKIRELIEEVIAKTETSPDASNAARSRAAFLKARLDLEDIFKLDPKLATPPALPAKIGAGDKVERAVKGLWSSKKKRDETQRIKDGLRDGTLKPEDAKAQLLLLQQQNQKVATDRRSAKIDFLITGTLFRKALEQSADRLGNLLNSAPEGLWSDPVASTLSQPICAAYQAWRTAAVKDDKTLRLLADVWAKFPDAVKSA